MSILLKNMFRKIEEADTEKAKRLLRQLQEKSIGETLLFNGENKNNGIEMVKEAVVSKTNPMFGDYGQKMTEEEYKKNKKKIEPENKISPTPNLSKLFFKQEDNVAQATKEVDLVTKIEKALRKLREKKMRGKQTNFFTKSEALKTPRKNEKSRSNRNKEIKRSVLLKKIFKEKSDKNTEKIKDALRKLSESRKSDYFTFNVNDVKSRNKQNQKSKKKSTINTKNVLRKFKQNQINNKHVSILRNKMFQSVNQSLINEIQIALAKEQNKRKYGRLSDFEKLGQEKTTSKSNTQNVKDKEVSHMLTLSSKMFQPVGNIDTTQIQIALRRERNKKKVNIMSSFKKKETKIKKIDVKEAIKKMFNPIIKKRRSNGFGKIHGFHQVSWNNNKNIVKSMFLSKETTKADQYNERPLPNIEAGSNIQQYITQDHLDTREEDGDVSVSANWFKYEM